MQTYIKFSVFNTMRSLEEDEVRLEMLKAALIEGENSGIVENFDPDGLINELKAQCSQ